MVHELFDILSKREYDFFTGVPDSALKTFQNDILLSNLMHIPAVNEAHAVAIAFGAELAGKKTCVYLQNSGLGNIINPLTSLCMPFNIYPLLVIGHRHTLPQHKIMGETDRLILETIGYDNYILVEGENNVK
jgi:sulfopyruvate decarboxylase TPP-binding subunit